jgi:hypothetical protein
LVVPMSRPTMMSDDFRGIRVPHCRWVSQGTKFFTVGTGVRRYWRASEIAEEGGLGNKVEVCGGQARTLSIVASPDAPRGVCPYSCELRGEWWFESRMYAGHVCRVHLRQRKVRRPSVQRRRSRIRHMRL